MTRELELPEPEPADDPGRPLFDRAFPIDPPSGRRIEVAGRPDTAPVPGRPAQPATRPGPPPGPLPPGPPPGPMPPGRTPSATAAPPAAPSAPAQPSSPAATSGAERSPIGMVHGPVRSEPRSTRMLGTAVGPALLVVLAVITLLHQGGGPVPALPLLVAALLLPAGGAAVQNWAGPGDRSNPSSPGGAAPRDVPFVSSYCWTATRFTLRSTTGLDTECLLLGTPSRPLNQALTLRRARPSARRSRLVRLRRLDVLAGPDGPPVGVIVGQRPRPARVGRWIDRLGWLAASLAVIEATLLLAGLG